MIRIERLSAMDPLEQPGLLEQVGGFEKKQLGALLATVETKIEQLGLIEHLGLIEQ